MRWPARLLLSCLILFTVLGLGIAAVAGSGYGLRWSVALLQAWVPGLHIERAQGRWIGPLRLQGIRYEDAHRRIAIAALDLDWQPGDLARGRLRLTHLVLSGVNAHIPTSATPGNSDTPITLPDLQSPLALIVDRLEVDQFHYFADETGESALALEHTHFSGSFVNDSLNITRLSLTAPQGTAELRGRLRTRAHYPLELGLHWRAAPAPAQAWEGRATLSGDVQTLRVELRLIQPATARIQGTLYQALGKRHWTAELNLPETDIRRFFPRARPLRIGAQLQGQGDHRAVAVRGTASTVTGKLDLKHTVNLSYDRGQTVDIKAWSVALGESTLRFKGRITQLRRGSPRVALSGQWSQLRWPLGGTARLRSTAGRFAVNGGLERYQVTAEAGLEGPDFPAGHWHIQGHGNQSGFTAETVHATILEGELSGQAHWTWAPSFTWNATLDGRRINPGAQWPQWPAHLAFSASSEGRLGPERYIALTVPKLNGTLKGWPVAAEADLRLSGDTLRITALHLASGPNILRAEGRLSDEWDMRLRVTAPDLKTLPGTGRGELLGAAYLSGPRDTPLISATATVRELHYGELAVARAEGVAVVDLQDAMPSMVQVNSDGITLDTTSVETMTLRMDGTLAQHSAAAMVDAPEARVAVELVGAYADHAWSGSIAHLALDTSRFGRWRSDAATPLRAARRHIRISRLCLKHDDGAEICARGEHRPSGAWQAEAHARHLGTALLQDWLPDTWRAGDGQTTADAFLQGAPGTPIKGAAYMEIAPGALHYTPLNIDWAYSGGGAALFLDADKVQLVAGLGFAGGGGFSGTLSVSRTGAGETAAPQLRGDIYAELLNLDGLTVLFPELARIDGKLSLKSEFSGSPNAPQVALEATLRRGRGEIPALGISPNDIGASLKVDRSGAARFSLSLKSGGELHIAGTADLGHARLNRAELSLTGNRVTFSNTPEFQLLASPKLKLNVRDKNITLGGELFIPQAYARPQDLSSAIQTSDDALPAQEGERPPPSPWKVNADIRLRLGEFVRFKGFGLRARASGNVAINFITGQITTARGELRVTEGEYRAYGQNLKIERGRLLFFGGPLDNPGLDIRAARHIQDVTAGVLVRGQLKSPRLTLFSDPTMAEADILAYILIGRPMNSATPSEGKNIYGAAVSLGLAGGGLLAAQIGQHFGIDDLRIESGGGFGEGALVIRHYLSPKLYLSYGVGLFERLNVFLLRYQISRLWALEAESGTRSGADLLYTLEAD